MSNQEVRMTMKTLASKGVANREIARQLKLSEGTIRYHRKRMAADTPDGRTNQQRLAVAYSAAIEHWRDTIGTIGNTAELHEWLVTEYCYPGSLRSIQRFVRERYPAPRVRTRRRVETPPGAQAQVDWAHFPGILVDGRRTDLYGFVMILSHSRKPVLVWSESMDMGSWLACHNSAFNRLGGIPAVVRVDNCKTAVARGAGPWGVINETYRRYAQTVRFHVDPCLPREPAAKGKVERLILTCRGMDDPSARAWDDLEQLQCHSDDLLERHSLRRPCPATGTSIEQAFRKERLRLGTLPLLPEPFDTVATREVGPDCMVAFEARHYSVPFRFVGEQVEVRGVRGFVQILHGARIIAEHARATDCRVVTCSEHFSGEPTPTHCPPMPLGRLGQLLEQIGEQPVDQRPADLYAAIAEGLAS